MAGYIGSKASVVSSGAERKKTFAITTSTTSLTGLSYTPTKAHVFHNGVRLVDGTDYTATDGTSITLNSAAESGDEVVVISYAGFQVADAYTQAEADSAFVSDPNGAITVDGGGNVVINSGKELRLNRPDGAIYGSISHGASGTGIVYNDANGDGHHFQLGGSERMRIDAAGRVTTPYQPAFNARGAASQTYTTTGWKQLFYPNSVSQRGSAYNSATSTFTAPVSAWYYFSITANFVSNSDSDGAISISKNGGTTDAGITVMQSQNGGNFNGRSASGVVYLTVNDYVNVWAYSTVNLTSRASTWAGHFSGYLIG